MRLTYIEITLHQQCATLEIKHRVLFNFQRQIIFNVNPQRSNNIDRMLKCWMRLSYFLRTKISIVFKYLKDILSVSCFLLLKKWNANQFL